MPRVLHIAIYIALYTQGVSFEDQRHVKSFSIEFYVLVYY